MFWAKWLGKLAGIANTQKNIEANVHKSEWFALLLMAILSGVCCAILPLISGYMVEPYIESIYNTGGQAIASSNLWIACIASVLIIVVLFAGVGRKQKGKQAQVYLSGVSANNAERAFINSLSGHSVATSKNLYLPSLFGEKEIRPVGVALCTLIIVAGFAASLATLPALL